VINGDEAALAKLYSVKPEAATQAGKNRIAVRDELAFWAGTERSIK